VTIFSVVEAEHHHCGQIWHRLRHEHHSARLRLGPQRACGVGERPNRALAAEIVHARLQTIEQAKRPRTVPITED
jgi:hypothetical protein